VLTFAEIDQQSPRFATALRRTGVCHGELGGIKTGTRVVHAPYRATETIHIVQDAIRSGNRDRTANAMQEYGRHTADSFQARVRLRPAPNQDDRPR
jgi:hypothetical protein